MSILKEKLDAIWNNPHVAYPRHRARWSARTIKGDGRWDVIGWRISCFRGTLMQPKLETKRQRQARIWKKTLAK